MIYDRMADSLGLFGSGDDGNVTAVTGSLTRNMYYNTLTVPNGVILDNDHFIIFAKESVIIQNGGKLWTTPNNGGNASGATAGSAAGGDQAQIKPLGRMFPGVAGRTGTTGIGATGVAFTTAHEFETNGGGTGSGGAGGNGINAGGNASPAFTAETTLIWRRITPWIIRATSKPGGNLFGPAGGGGAAAGGGSGVAAGGGGGGGGSSGGCIMIWSPIIQVDSGGILSVQGGNGGNGGNGAGVSTGGGGTGAGGGGGHIYLFCHKLINNGTISVAGGSAGATVGTAGAGGTNGSLGTAGANGRLIVYYLLAGKWSVT